MLQRQYKYREGCDVTVVYAKSSRVYKSKNKICSATQPLLRQNGFHAELLHLATRWDEHKNINSQHSLRIHALLT